MAISQSAPPKTNKQMEIRGATDSTLCKIAAMQRDIIHKLKIDTLK